MKSFEPIRPAATVNRLVDLPPEEAGASRERMTRFWLSAPVDQLEVLYAGSFGQVYRLMLNGLLPSQPLQDKEKQWKETLTQRLLSGFGSHETISLLLAVMPYYGLNGMRVAEPLQQVPEWLLFDYAQHCDAELTQFLAKRGRAASPALLAPAALAQPAMAQPAGVVPAGGAPYTELPVLCEKRRDACMPLIRDNEFLGRMSGLINLFSIDPGDGEVKRQLSALRRQVAQIWLDVDTEQLEALYRTPFGQLTQNLIGCGFANVPLDGEEELLRAQLSQVVREMRHPLALNAVMASLLYFTPANVSFSGAESMLPPWLIQELSSLRSRSQPG
ncbi:MAG: hypothetical protein NTW83_05980 [Cyanobacteria bacterium]|nr:hypothetical protein [Cyanobacteriota bacterium]